MDVLDRKFGSGGHELIETVVSLSGIPAPLMERELEKILETSGHAPADLTLEGLRAALLAYMETLSPEMFAEEQGSVTRLHALKFD